MKTGGHFYNCVSRNATALLIIIAIVFGTGAAVLTDIKASAANDDNAETSVIDYGEYSGENKDGKLFADVSQINPYYHDIMFLAENGYINGSGNDCFRPDDFITPAEALTILERLYGDPAILPKTWEEWCSPSFSYQAKWFDPVETRGEYVDSFVSLDSASLWILAILKMPLLPRHIYAYPDSAIDTRSEALWSMLIYGNPAPGYMNRPGYERITRGEFCNLVVWAGDIVGVIPEPRFNLPVEMSVVTDGYETEYMASINSLFVQDTLLLVPEAILQSFADNGYAIKVMPRDAYIEYVESRYGPTYANTTSGLYIHAAEGRQGEIVVNSTSPETILHEMGHYVFLNILTEWADVEMLFEDENELAGVSGCFLSDYCKKNVKEFFAESFVAYIKMPELLAERAPLTYSLIDGLVL